jgi:hypothetical protein
METDLSSADPVQGAEINFNGLHRPDPYAEQHHHEGDEEDRTMLSQPSMMPPPPQDYMYYAPPPPQPHIPEPPTKPGDIFSNMDRTTWVLLIIAFVVGFFMGRGMIQPVILRSHAG